VVRWAHASELPDPSEWLEPGALVMTTGLGLAAEPGAQGAYVERLARAGLSGLLIGEMADERINAELRRSPVHFSGGEELVLSISVGARRYAGEDDFREILAKADAAMYQAKREGRAWVLTG
jgi:GGDEF domain-containing protein